MITYLPWVGVGVVVGGIKLAVEEKVIFLLNNYS